MCQLHGQKKLTPAQSVYFVKPRPAEELFDCQADPHELANLISNPAHATVLQELRGALDEWAKETGDYVPNLRTADEFDRLTGLPTPARVRPRLSKKQMVKKGLAAP